LADHDNGMHLEHARSRGLAANLGEAHLRLWNLIDHGTADPTGPTRPADPTGPAGAIR
jgi:hypothetical protein